MTKTIHSMPELRGADAGSAPLLELRSVSKAFSGVRVVEDVDMTVVAGSMVGLIGENGAGKSTLMKIVAGVYPVGSFDGEVRIAAERAGFHHPSDAKRRGVVLVPQELQIAPELSIAENMFRGHLPGRAGVVDRRQLRRDARAALEFFEIAADPLAPARVLAPSEQRLMMIAAALSESARLLILDEPTAALTESESETLFDHVRALKERGIGCVHITHRLDEVEQEADDVVVMRNGRVVERFEGVRPKRTDLVRAMIGRDPETVVGRVPQRRTEPVLEVEEIVVRDPGSTARPRVDRASFVLDRGEILGLFGLVGAGRTEMARAIFGAWPGEHSGRVRLHGRELRPRSTREAIAAGLAMLPEDRKASGIVHGQSVNANMSAASLQRVSGWLRINHREERARNRKLIERLGVRPPRLDVEIDTLSGGNQQKVMLARCLATEPEVLILDEPTFGVDVGARYDLYRIVRDLADAGRAVLLISSDLEEVRTECDRILVMCQGRITGEFAGDASRHDLMVAATGGDAQ